MPVTLVWIICSVVAQSDTWAPQWTTYRQPSAARCSDPASVRSPTAISTGIDSSSVVSLVERTRHRTWWPSSSSRCAMWPPMNPVAPVTRQALSALRSSRRPRGGMIAGSVSSLPILERRVSVAVAISRTTPQLWLLEPWTSASTFSKRSRNRLTSSSVIVSAGSSLITSFLPPAIVITLWSRCSGITISCGNRPPEAMWIKPPVELAGGGSTAVPVRSRRAVPSRGRRRASRSGCRAPAGRPSAACPSARRWRPARRAG